jgi:quercetin dioxygenase-like cupin family protein
MANPVRGFVVLDGEGEQLQAPIGGPATIKARTETTDGTITALEVVVPPTKGPPLHRHRREDELWYLLAGHLRIKLNEQLLDAPTGSLVFIPRGTPHCFQNLGNDPARLLAVFTPAGMERFFEGAAALPPGALDSAAFHAVAHRAGMEVVGKPLAEAEAEGRAQRPDASSPPRRLLGRRGQSAHGALAPGGTALRMPEACLCCRRSPL